MDINDSETRVDTLESASLDPIQAPRHSTAVTRSTHKTRTRVVESREIERFSRQGLTLVPSLVRFQCQKVGMAWQLRRIGNDRERHARPCRPALVRGSPAAVRPPHELAAVRLHVVVVHRPPAQRNGPTLHSFQGLHSSTIQLNLSRF